MVSSQYSCTNCGAANQAQDAHCPVCGHPLQNKAASPQPSIAGSASNTSAELLPPGLLLKQRYRILRQIGKGGFGAVYVAEDMQLGNRLLAIKEMSQNSLSSQEIVEATENFKREALLLAALTHPMLPSIYDHFSEAGSWYLVMDFIAGETLETYAQKQPESRLPVEETLQLGMQLCTVLEYLHSRQPPIIFRDLKPSNIMRTPEGVFYLIDFGIARHFKPGQARDTIAFGSPGYAAPEQYGKAQTTARSDIYSLGATLHSLLTGVDPSYSPFHFAPLQLPDQHIALGLTPLLMQMLDMDVSKRPTSMMAVRQELQRLLAKQQTVHANIPSAKGQSATPGGNALRKAQTKQQAQTGTPSGASLQIGQGNDQFAPTTVDQIAEYVGAQRSHTALFPFMLFVLLVLNILIVAVLSHLHSLVVFLPICLLTLLTNFYVVRLTQQHDRKVTHVALNYQLGSEESKKYQRLCSGLEALAKVHRLQLATESQSVTNWKRHAGARQTISFRPLRLLPPRSLAWLETNIPIWGLQWDRVVVIFLPDCLLFEMGKKKKVVALRYQDLMLSSSSSEFIEARVPPADAKILRHTWRYVNKNGTPDLRYRNNYQVAVTEATYIDLRSNSGLRLLLQASNQKLAEFFLDGLRSFRSFPLLQQVPQGQQAPQVPTRKSGSSLHEPKDKRHFNYPRGQNPFDATKLDSY